MTVIIEEQDLHIDADEWKSVVGMGLKEDYLEQLVEEYLANGGQIQEVPPGVTAECFQVKISGFNVVDSAQASLRIKQRVARRSKADEELVTKLNDLLGHHVRKDMRKMLGISDGKLQRLLNDYFADDPRADASRASPNGRDEPETIARRVKEVQAAGVKGMSATIKAVGTSYPMMRRLIQMGMVKVEKTNRHQKALEQPGKIAELVARVEAAKAAGASGHQKVARAAHIGIERLRWLIDQGFVEVQAGRPGRKVTDA